MNEELYTVEYRDSRERWHRPRSQKFMFASDAIRTASATYEHGWRVLDADGTKIADHLGNGVALDRTHRFAIGDLVVAADSTPDTEPAVVEELTIFIKDGRAYPTYTLIDPNGGTLTDVLCTYDLRAI